MSRLNERDIARKLAEREDFEPPAGLLDKIKSEIPPTITVGAGVPGAERRSPMATKQRWLIAASVVAMAGAGPVALQVREQAAPMVQERVEDDSVAPARKQAPAEARAEAPVPSTADQVAPQAPPAMDQELRLESKKESDAKREADLPSTLQVF